MTTYLQNPHLQRLDEYLKDQTWFKDMVVESTGIFNMPLKYMRDKYVQLDKIIAQAANIRKSVDLEYPDTAKSQLKSFTRLAVWFTAKMGLSHDQYQDYLAGDPRIKTEIDGQVDSINFNFNKDRREWFVDGPTSGTDPNYISDWIPWWKLVATGSSNIGNPADMNGKAGGTAGAILDLTSTAVLWSSSTNASINFHQALLSEAMTAFEDFEDSSNGRRMVNMNANEEGINNYTLFVDLPVIRKFKDTNIYNGEFWDNSRNVYQSIADMGVEIKPDPTLSSSFAEDGEIQFRLVAEIERNFKRGIVNKPKWTGWEPTDNSLTPGVHRGFSVRYVPFTMPYYDGTNYFKAMVKGKFTYKNDAA